MPVAGATFAVPIWHEYMAAALYHHKVLDFPPPDKYPVWRGLTHGYYGYLGSYYTPPPVTHDGADDDVRADHPARADAALITAS